jgi:hypothetical protein
MSAGLARDGSAAARPTRTPRACRRSAELGVAAQREPGGDWGAGPSLGFALLLFDQGQGETAAAGARLRLRLHRHVQIAVEVRSAARILRDRCAALLRRERSLQQEHLPAQERFVHETLQNYNAMQIGAFEVLRARQQQLAAAGEHLGIVREAWLCRLDLEELFAGSVPRAALQPAWLQFGTTTSPQGEGH